MKNAQQTKSSVPTRSRNRPAMTVPIPTRARAKRRRGNHDRRPDQRVVPGEREAVDPAEEQGRDRLELVPRKVRFEKDPHAPNWLGPPGRVQGVNNRCRHHAPQQQCSARRVGRGSRAAQAARGNGRNQPVNLVAAAQPQATPEGDDPGPAAGLPPAPVRPPARTPRPPGTRDRASARHRTPGERGRTSGASSTIPRPPSPRRPAHNAGPSSSRPHRPSARTAPRGRTGMTPAAAGRDG